jgi:hypothetical protein
MVPLWTLMGHGDGEARDGEMVHASANLLVHASANGAC